MSEKIVMKINGKYSVFGPELIDRLFKGRINLSTAEDLAIKPRGEKSENGYLWFARRVAEAVGLDPKRVRNTDALDLICALADTNPPLAGVTFGDEEHNIPGGYVIHPDIEERFQR